MQCLTKITDTWEQWESFQPVALLERLADISRDQCRREREAAATVTVDLVAGESPNEPPLLGGVIHTQPTPDDTVLGAPEAEKVVEDGEGADRQGEADITEDGAGTAVREEPTNVPAQHRTVQAEGTSSNNDHTNAHNDNDRHVGNNDAEEYMDPIADPHGDILLRSPGGTARQFREIPFVADRQPLGLDEYGYTASETDEDYDEEEEEGEIDGYDEDGWQVPSDPDSDFLARPDGYTHGDRPLHELACLCNGCVYPETDYASYADEESMELVPNLPKYTMVDELAPGVMARGAGGGVDSDAGGALAVDGNRDVLGDAGAEENCPEYTAAAAAGHTVGEIGGDRTPNEAASRQRPDNEVLQRIDTEGRQSNAGMHASAFPAYFGPHSPLTSSAFPHYTHIIGTHAPAPLVSLSGTAATRPSAPAVPERPTLGACGIVKYGCSTRRSVPCTNGSTAFTQLGFGPSSNQSGYQSFDSTARPYTSASSQLDTGARPPLGRGNRAGSRGRHLCTTPACSSLGSPQTRGTRRACLGSAIY